MPTRAKKKGAETSLSRAIQSVLTAKGAWIVRVQAGVIPALYGTTKRFIHLAEPGCPDLLVMVPGRSSGLHMPIGSARFMWLEVKTKTGRLSKDQIDWHARAHANGVDVRVVRSISDAIDAVFFPDRARSA